MRRLLPLIGLLALATAEAKKPEPEPEPAPAEPAAPTVSVEQRTQAFAAHDAAVQSGQKAAAADALLPVLDDPALQPLHGEAWAKMGDLLASFDMEYSALIAYAKAIEADPQAGSSKVQVAMDLAAKLGDERVLAPALAANVGLPVDEATRSRMAFLAARHHFQDENYGTAVGILAMVGKDSPVYPRSEALRGVILAQQGRPNDALAPFLTAQAMKDKVEDPARFEDVLDLNIGRAYFAAANFPRAIEYYAKVDRASPYWPEAQFERAWAHFRLEDMNGTLGLLHNHTSPFFEDWYFPEGELLRVYAEFLLCKFPEANQDITAFSEHYTPVKAELDRTLGGMTAQDAWQDVRAYIEERPTKLPGMILRPYRYDDRMKGAVQSVQKAEDELARLANAAANPSTARARERLERRRDEIARTEGDRVLAAAVRKRDELDQMLGSVEITKIDILQFETQLYEKAAVTGQIDYGDRIGQLRKLRKTRGARVWPYQGEYWADELGYYRYDVRPDCPTDMAAGGK